MIISLKNYSQYTLSKEKKRVLSTLLFILSFTSSIIGQLGPDKALSQYTLETWTTDEGLPSSTLLELHQSKDGYLWICSFQGLIRFDGINFTVFDKSNVDALNANSVVTIEEDINGVLWLGTEGAGLMSYQNGEFTAHGDGEFNNFILSIHIDSEKNVLWIGTTNKGLYMYDYTTFSHVDYAPINDITIIDVLKDNSDGLWVATEGNGLSYLKDGEWTTYTEEDGLTNDNVISLYKDSNDILWVTTISGLCKFDGKSFTKIMELDGFEVNRLFEDKSGLLFIATQNGLCRINPISNSIDWLREEHGLLNQEIIDLLHDVEGNLWMTTYRGGLCKLVNGKFHNYTINEGLSSRANSVVYELKNGDYLLGGNYGKINKIENGKITAFNFKTKLIKDRIFGICEDKFDNLWVSTYGGLLRIKPDGKETLFTTENGLPNDRIKLAYEDRQGQFWIGTRTAGLLKLHDNNSESLTYQNFDQSNGLTSNFVMSISEDLEGNLLVGTNTGGLNIIDKEESIQVFSTNEGLISNLIFNAHTDSEGVIWIVSNGGLSRLKGGRIFNFTKEDGLPSDSPFDFLEDNFGFAWMPTSSGIIRVSKQQLIDYAEGLIETIDWELFNESDGMKRSECVGATKSLKASDGKLWFPTFGGISVMDPINIPVNERVPQVHMQGLLIENTPVNLNEAIEISAENRRMVFKFTTTSLQTPLKNQFKYKIENFDADWIDSNGERQAVYTNLSPGNYTFRVIASNNDDVWNLEGDAVSFVITPPWWLTWWMVTIYILMSIGVPLGFYYLRINVLTKQKNELTNQVEKRTKEIVTQNSKLIDLNREKDGMIDVVAHDLKSPLNSIKGLLQLLPLSGKLNNEQTEYIDNISVIVNEGNLLIKDLLDAHAMDQQEFSVELVELNMKNFVTIWQKNFQSEFKRKNQLLEIDIPNKLLIVIDEMILTRILDNLITNAIKFSDKGKKIYVHAWQDSTLANFSVRDEGPGISKEDQDKMFKTFQKLTARPTSGESSNGLGLSIIKSLVNKLDGEILVKSKLGEGTEFIVKIPLKLVSNDDLK